FMVLGNGVPTQVYTIIVGHERNIEMPLFGGFVGQQLVFESLVALAALFSVALAKQYRIDALALPIMADSQCLEDGHTSPPGWLYLEYGPASLQLVQPKRFRGVSKSRHMIAAPFHKQPGRHTIRQLVAGRSRAAAHKTYKPFLQGVPACLMLLYLHCPITGRWLPFCWVFWVFAPSCFWCPVSWAVGPGGAARTSLSSRASSPPVTPACVFPPNSIWSRCSS